MPSGSNLWPSAALCAAWLLWTPPAWCVELETATTPLGRYIVDSWTTEDGLPQSSVNDIAQTRDGYLWLATFGGLARFDGLRFEVFDQASTPSLPISRVVSLEEDRAGDLWLGLETHGLLVYRGGAFVVPRETRGLAELGTVWDLAEQADGTLWAGTDVGLVRLSSGSAELLGEADGLPAGAALALHVDRQDRLWVSLGPASRPQPLVARLDGERFEAWPAPNSAHEMGFVELPGGEMLATWGNRPSRYAVSLFDDGRWHDLTREGTSWRLPPGTSGPEPGVWSEDRLLVVRGDLVSVVTEPNAGYARAVLRDRESSVWIGTNGQGLYRLRRKLVQHYTLGPRGGAVRSIIGDGEGGLWLGTGENQLVRLRDGAARFVSGSELFGPMREPHPRGSVAAFCRDRSGRLWVGYGSHLARWNQSHLEVLPEARGSGAVASIRALFEDSQGRLWIGGFRGLARLTDERLEVFTEQTPVLASGVQYIAEGPAGTIWFGGLTGMSRFRNGVFVDFTDEDGLPPGAVRALHPEDDGTLWIGTYGGGLVRFRSGELVRIGRDQGLPDNVVSRILEDGAGRFWINGNLAVYGVARSELHAVADGRTPRVHPIVFDARDGTVEGTGGAQPAGWRSDDGRLWFPTIEGLMSLEPDEVRLEKDRPDVVIERVLAGGREYLPPFSAIRLAPEHRDLEIHYTALSLARPDRSEFRYRLTPSSAGWIEAGRRRIAFFTAVPHGRYTFQVTATDSWGRSDETGAGLELTVAPFYWETIWFRLSVLLAVAGAVLWVFRLRIRRIRAHNLALEAEIAERKRVELEREQLISELESINAELERFTYTVSHDLKSPLVTISGFLGLLDQDVESGDRERVRRNTERIAAAVSQMRRLLDELLELSRIGRVVNPPEATRFETLIEEALARVDHQLSASGAEVHVEEDLPVVNVDRTRMVEVLQNLLDNAVKFMGAQTEPRIEIGVHRRAEGPVFYVADNGIGIDSEYHERVFQLFEQLAKDGRGTGIGLTLARRIVEIHGGRLWVESEGRDRGSRFCFTLG